MSDNHDESLNSDALDSANVAKSSDSIHEAILETLASAVISIESGGVVTSFNSTAAKLTGLKPDQVIGRTFASAFFELDGTDQFTETVLDAIYDGSLVRQRMVEATFPSGPQLLSMSVSKVTSERDDAEETTLGVAVVFDDVSEISELREKELALAREIEGQNKELRDAYITLEEQNREFADAQRRSRLIRNGGMTGIVLLLALLGFYTMRVEPEAPDAAVAELPLTMEDGEIFVVEPKPLSTSINITGRLGPREEFDITSPLTGKVAVVYVPYGASVAKGDRLLDLDNRDVLIRVREAEAAYITARERFQVVSNWSESVEASRARRGVTKARIDFTESEKQLEETEFLFERGVIPESEFKAAERNLRGRELDLEAAEQDLAVILAKGTADASISRLELENAKARLDELQTTLELARVIAPIAGVVLRSPVAGASETGSDDPLVAGKPVTEGERLLTIGDVNGLSIMGRVDEVDIIRIQPGNSVRVTGSAFPGVILHGEILRVSSEATLERSGGNVPYFEIVASVTELRPEQLKVLRIGMSVTMEIVVRQSDDALLIPIDAVQFINDEATVVLAQGDQRQRISVTPGVTTFDSVEIVMGLNPGDQILVR